MIFSWFKRRRRAALGAKPFPREWLDTLERNMWVYPLLNADERRRLQDIVRVLVAEKNWEGLRGVVMNDEIKVTIAGWGALLLLNIEHDYYPATLSILVNPTSFQGMRPEEGTYRHVPAGHNWGEAWYRGPVILAWDEVLRDGRRRGNQNLAIHEFSHQLDMLNRAADGIPPLDTTAQFRSWEVVMGQEYQRLTDAAERGLPTLLDKYGAQNEAEFFAVASECFFENGSALQSHHPELYAILKDYYRQDPAERG